MALILRAIRTVQARGQFLIEDILRLTSIAGNEQAIVPSLAGIPTSQSDSNSDPLAWDGIMYAGGLGGAPKIKPGIERRRRKKRDLRKFSPFLRSRHMIVPCDGCGGYYKKYHLCGTCYEQTRFETQQVRNQLKEAGLDLNQETVVKYKDAQGRFDFGPNKQVLNVNRNTPMGWFSQNFWGK